MLRHICTLPVGLSHINLCISTCKIPRTPKDMRHEIQDYVFGLFNVDLLPWNSAGCVKENVPGVYTFWACLFAKNCDF